MDGPLCVTEYLCVWTNDVDANPVGIGILRHQSGMHAEVFGFCRLTYWRRMRLRLCACSSPRLRPSRGHSSDNLKGSFLAY